MAQQFDFISQGLSVIDIELEAINSLKQSLDGSFQKACETILATRGRVVVIGMGKSGHIGGKIAATMASTGTPAFFVHPGEASHGDLGMITEQDTVIAISNSGQTEEVTNLLPVLKRKNVNLISVTGNPQSVLAQAADIHLSIAITKEACPFNLAPTASTTATLVLGDALAIALLQAKGFTQEDFALSHPGGSLGRRLLLHVSDIMHTGDAVPKVTAQATVKDALIEMTRKRLGMTTIVNQQNKLIGVFTDGDVRRLMQQDFELHQALVADVMNKNPKAIQADVLAVDAVTLMEDHKISQLVVVCEQGKPIGALNMHDLLQAGVV